MAEAPAEGADGAESEEPEITPVLRESGALGAGRPQLAPVCRRHCERTACMDRRRSVFVVVMFFRSLRSLQCSRATGSGGAVPFARAQS